MKYLLLFMSISWQLYGLQSQYQGDFRRRFGSGSTIYTLPVLFSRPHMKTSKESRAVKQRNFHKKIKKTHQDELKKFRQTNLQDPDLLSR